MTKRRLFPASLQTFLIGADPPPTTPRRLAAARLAGLLCALYLTYAAATYLDLKSGLPTILCWPLGLLLGAPFALAFTHPLLAWRVAFVTALLGGIPVQVHQHTPFSWHPALLAAQFVTLIAVAARHRLAVAAWAWLSVAVLVTVSFFPADRIPLMEIVTVLMSIGYLTHRFTLARRRVATPSSAPSSLATTATR
ncbi:hypothetical protein [Paractinoplanes globisporus]|uniref:Uncharacterized protein n=1 Tax=Paractinoplanes globisporus TaxID=113565 RepID=A0ABW6WDD4_9ACTN|nr:hypothetical protein [Actinoplanes globisporus]